MKKTITELLRRYEGGTVTRRDLIAALAALVAGGSHSAAAATLSVTRIDHLALQVSNLQRSRDFYVAAFGASINTNPRPANEIRVDLGPNSAIVLRQAGTPGALDHVGVVVQGFDRSSVARQLQASGVNLVDAPTTPGTPGFHVIDPDGFKVQLQ